jgi:hypothetical protein
MGRGTGLFCPLSRERLAPPKLLHYSRHGCALAHMERALPHVGRSRATVSRGLVVRPLQRMLRSVRCAPSSRSATKKQRRKTS